MIVSRLFLKSNVVDDAPLIDLEKVFDPPLTSLSFIAPSFSSTPMDTSVSAPTLLASPLPLAQCIGLEMGETSKGDVSDLEDDSLEWSKELTLVGPYPEEASFEELCGDIMIGSAPPSVVHTNPICYWLFDLTLISSALLPTPRLM